MADSVYKNLIQEVPLSNLVEIRSARKPERVEDYRFDSSLPYVDIKMLESGVSNRFAEDNRFAFNSDDLIMVKDGYRSGKVFRTQEEGIAASTLVVLSLKQDYVLVDYLYCYLTYCYEHFQINIKGDFISHLDMNYLKQLKVPVPSLSKQKEIAEQYLKIESRAKDAMEKSLRLKDLSLKLKSKELKEASEYLNKQVEMIQKSWLNQIFKH